MFEAEGYHVTTVPTASEAFDLLAASPVRMIVVFDFALPDTDLDRTLFTIMARAVERHSYVLLTSRVPPFHVQERAATLGVQLVLIPAMMDGPVDVLRGAEQRLAAAS